MRRGGATNFRYDVTICRQKHKVFNHLIVCYDFNIVNTTIFFRSIYFKKDRSFYHHMCHLNHVSFRSDIINNFNHDRNKVCILDIGFLIIIGLMTNLFLI